MRTDYSCLWRSFAAKGADVRLMRKEPNRPRAIGAGSISDLKTVSSPPATFPLVLVASSRPFLVLYFGSSAVPVPRVQAWVLASAQALPPASVRALPQASVRAELPASVRAWSRASVQAEPPALARALPPASVRAEPPALARKEAAEEASRLQVDSREQVAWPLLRGSLYCRATAEA